MTLALLVMATAYPMPTAAARARLVLRDVLIPASAPGPLNLRPCADSANKLAHNVTLLLHAHNALGTARVAVGR